MGILSDSSIVDVLVGIGSLLILSYFYLTSTYNYWRDRGIPFVKPILLFGNIKDVLLGRKSIIEVHTKLYKQFEGERFGGYFVLRRPVLMVRDPELIERILVKDFAHFHDRGMTTDPDHEPLTLNLFNAKGNQWRNLRYKLTPTFTSGKLKGMFEQIHNCGEDLMKELQKYAESGENVEAKNLFSLFTTDVIASCAFGLQLRGGSSEADTFKTMTNKIFAPSIMQTLRFNLRSLYPRLTKWFGITTFGKDVNEYFLNITKATIQLRETKGTKRNDFVQLLMNLKDQEQLGKIVSVTSEISEEDKVISQSEYTTPETDTNQLNNEKLFTDECIAAQTFVFLIAGSESSSGALSFILYCLAKNPEVQRKAQAEIDQVLAKYGSWTYQTLKDLMYLDQAIQEGMRMFPIATFLSRDCTIPYQLPGTNIVLEKGQRVIIPVPALQNDPRIYPQPHIFDPDRFQDNNHKPSATYLPFGDGPRICIGKQPFADTRFRTFKIIEMQENCTVFAYNNWDYVATSPREILAEYAQAMRFAVLEMKVCLARVLSQYSVCLSDKTQEPISYLPGSFFPQAVGGIWITVQKRHSKDG